MKKTKVSKSDIEMKKVQDKTDWNKVYSQSQDLVDREALLDKENPVLKGVRYKPLRPDVGIYAQADAQKARSA